MKIYKDTYYQSEYIFDSRRFLVWREVVNFLSGFIPKNAVVLDLGAGYCDFITHVEYENGFYKLSDNTGALKGLPYKINEEKVKKVLNNNRIISRFSFGKTLKSRSPEGFNLSPLYMYKSIYSTSLPKVHLSILMVCLTF